MAAIRAFQEGVDNSRLDLSDRRPGPAGFAVTMEENTCAGNRGGFIAATVNALFSRGPSKAAR